MSKSSYGLLAYAIGQWEGYHPARHHKLLAAKLQEVARGTVRRLMVFMPPRHGKSMLASEFFPAWYLGVHPDQQLIAATYAQGLADDFGRKVRNLVTSEQHKFLFPEFKLSDDSQAANRFHTDKRGAYFAVGAGGPITGRGANLLLIDDPIKGRDDAESDTMRQRLKDWYTSVARTRLMPGGAIVVIQCMTGDTKVLMADGSEKDLRDIRPGDQIATYEDGRLTTSFVRNWQNNGCDYVLTIRMKSGLMVRANERHPFLVCNNGEETWTRLRNLKVGDKIVRAVCPKDSGRGNYVPRLDVKNPSNSRDFAPTTTINTNGQADTAQLPVMPLQGARRTLSTAMGSILQNMKRSLLNKVGSALSAACRLAIPTPGAIGKPSCALTTTTSQGKSGVCCAMTATSPLDMGKPSPSYLKPLNTYEITHDEIVEIVESGYEDVFDIQVDRTENFIANGLVSHNTRWHEDDLAGWLLKEHKHEGWEVLNLPALCEGDDALGRKEGEPLWPEAYPEAELEVIRKSVGSRDWNALYQQRPAAAEGSIFKRENWRYFKPTEVEPKSLAASLDIHTICQAWDTAFKTGTTNDYSVCVTIGISQNRYYVLDLWRDRVEFPDLKRVVGGQALKWGAHAVLIEDTAAGQSLIQELVRNSRIPILPVKADRDKVSRSNAVTPTHEANLCYLPDNAPWAFDFLEEMGSFPFAAHDDQVDAFVHAMTWAIRITPPSYDEPDEEFFGITRHAWLS